MEFYYRLNPIDENGVSLKGYRQRIYRVWLWQGPFGNATEQRICNEANAIRKNGWLMERELEIIKRKMIRTTGSRSARESGC